LFELSESDVRLLKLFRQTVPQRWPGGSKTVVTELAVWSRKIWLHKISCSRTSTWSCTHRQPTNTMPSAANRRQRHNTPETAIAYVLRHWQQAVIMDHMEPRWANLLLRWAHLLLSLPGRHGID